MKSVLDQPTEAKLNKEHFLEVLRLCDPELYTIKMALEESDVNPIIIPKIIRTIGNLTIGTGYGKIQIFMQAKVITQIKPEENVDVNEPASIDRDIDNT